MGSRDLYGSLWKQISIISRDLAPSVSLIARFKYEKVSHDRNCLFRAISDQLTGSSDKHFSLRKEVVDYLGRHRSEFEPFLVDETSYDRHLELLGQDGTFGGD